MDKPKGDYIILYAKATCSACGHEHKPNDKVMWVKPVWLDKPGMPQLKDPGGCYCLGCADDGSADEPVKKPAKPKKPSPKSKGERIITMFEAVCPGCGNTVPERTKAVWFPSKGKVQGGIYCATCAGEIG